MLFFTKKEALIVGLDSKGELSLCNENPFPVDVGGKFTPWEKEKPEIVYEMKTLEAEGDSITLPADQEGEWKITLELTGLYRYILTMLDQGNDDIHDLLQRYTHLNHTFDFVTQLP